MRPVMRPAISSVSTSDFDLNNAALNAPSAEHDAGIAADYFDGRSARAHPVRLRFEGGQLLIDGEQVSRSVPAGEVMWPERTRHGARVAHLADGASMHSRDSAAWDEWIKAGGLAESFIVKAQQSWRWVFAGVAVLVVSLIAGYLWGLPWAARQAVAMLPQSVDETIGESALASIDEQLMKPSELPADQQARIRAAFERAVSTLPTGSIPAHQLVFRKSRIGPNAFALPGGTMVMTDELVKRVNGDEAIIVGVLGHELGHVRQRHGMRMLAQVSALGAVSATLFGDFNSLLAAAPVFLGQASYSRDAEREADAESVRLMKSAGVSPMAMVRFFEMIEKTDPGEEREEMNVGEAASMPKRAEDTRKPQDTKARENRRRERSWLGIAIGSHPADEERMAFFRNAAGR